MENISEHIKAMEHLKEKATISELKDIIEDWASYDEDDKIDLKINYLPQNILLSNEEFFNVVQIALNEKLDEYDPEHLAAAEYLGDEPDDIEEESYSHYGLRVFSSGRMEVAVGDDAAAQSAAEEYIRDTLWAFNAGFISCHTKNGLSDRAEKALAKMQGELCEDANDIIEALIDDLDDFISDAISSDGRGFFLSGYDGEENEVTINNKTYYVYRIN